MLSSIEVSTFNLRQLRYFVAAAEAGSLASASRKINISQPSISSAIKELEETFHLNLLIRHHGSGVSLTPSGTRFYNKATELLRHANEFETTASVGAGSLVGQLEVGCFSTVAPIYMPMLLSAFMNKHPGVEINLKDGQENALIDGLEAGRFDAVMLYDYGLSLSFDRVPFVSDLVPHLVLPKGHRLSGQSEAALADVISEPFILLDMQPSATFFRKVFDDAGLAPNISYRSPSVEMVRGLVARGLGFSILVSKPYSNLTYDGNEVCTVPLSDDVQRSTLVLAWLRSSTPSRLAKTFIEFCQSTGNRLKSEQRTDSFPHIDPASYEAARPPPPMCRPRRRTSASGSS